METKRIEPKTDVEAYLSKMKYALEHGAKLTFQIDRKVDENREYEPVYDCQSVSERKPGNSIKERIAVAFRKRISMYDER